LPAAAGFLILKPECSVPWVADRGCGGGPGRPGHDDSNVQRQDLAMPLMEWNDRMSVGVTQFDAEHKKLISLINDLFDAVQAGRGRDALGGILDGLITYTKTHFANEEANMQKLGYPDLSIHRKEHEALTQQVLEVQRKYHSGATAMLSMEVLTFLKNWLIKHIQGTDKLYGPFFNDKGLR